MLKAKNRALLINFGTIDLSVIHDTYGCRHSGAGRNPDNYQSPRITSDLADVFWQPSRMASSSISGTTPPNTALTATRSYLANWIPACAGMTDQYKRPVFNLRESASSADRNDRGHSSE